jgi:hypothetical protein
MPKISDLPVATTVDAADQVPLSQGGTTRSVSIGEMLSATQPAISTPTGTLLGRISLGPGGPEPITLGTGLALTGNAVHATGADHATFTQKTALQLTDQAVLNSSGVPSLLPLSALRGLFSAGTNVTIDGSGVISASGNAGGSGTSGTNISGLNVVASLASTDLVAVSQGGTNSAITYANFVDGETIDQGTPAGPAADTDLFWVGQGTSTMLVQTMAAVWSWVAGHLPGYRRPVVEITTDTTLDGSSHNGRILVVSQPVTLTHSSTEGSGFACTVINVSSGSVVFDSGITTTSGSSSLAAGQCAEIYAVSYSGGSVNLACISGSVAVPAPGQVIGVTIGTVTYSAVTLSWSVPTSGGAPTGYVVQYRITGQSPWSTQSTSVTSAQLAGLSADTQYDIEVLALNVTGFGTPSTVVNATTPASPSVPPDAPTDLVASAPTTTTLALAWVAPTSGGAVGSYTVQYRVTGQSAWTTFASGITVTDITVTGLASSTGYDFQVIAVNTAGSSSPSTIANGSTTVAAPGVPSGLAVATITQTTAAVTWTAPAAGGAVASYTLQYRPTGTSAWQQVAGIVALSDQLAGLSAGTQYDVQVAATNAGGTSAFTGTVTFTTVVAAPGTPTGLAAGTATSTTQPLSWTAPASGGPVVSYNVRYSVDGASTWTTVSGITGTSATVTGLSASTAYDYQVEAVNAGGTSAWSSQVVSTTAAPSNYLLTSFAPAAGYTAAHGTNGIIVQINDNSATGDGTHTVPHAVNIAWSTGNTTVPSSGLQTTTQYSNGGHNLWVTYANGPTTAGTWYVWGIAYDAGGNIVATCVSTGFVFT